MRTDDRADQNARHSNRYGTAPMYHGASGSHGEVACMRKAILEIQPTRVIDVTVALSTTVGTFPERVSKTKSTFSIEIPM